MSTRDILRAIKTNPSTIDRIIDFEEVQEKAEELQLPACTFNLSDAGNAELIAALHGDKFRHDHSRGRDLLFEGHRWRQDVSDRLVMLAKEAARQRYLLATGISDTKERERAARWAIQSEAKSRIDAALAMARCERPIADDGRDWDNRPMLLAVSNGVVDLETGMLRNGVANDRLILHTPVQLIRAHDVPCLKNSSLKF
jgi:phage/plasmid-associated DNA primase